MYEFLCERKSAVAGLYGCCLVFVFFFKEAAKLFPRWLYDLHSHEQFIGDSVSLHPC